jgi:hypothetical protein
MEKVFTLRPSQLSASRCCKSLSEKQTSQNDCASTSCKDGRVGVSSCLSSFSPSHGRSLRKVTALECKQLGSWENSIAWFSSSLPTFLTHLFEKPRAMHRCRELFWFGCLCPTPQFPWQPGTLYCALLTLHFVWLLVWLSQLGCE